ncbi:hypothetical protein E2562_012086 [Oryza meyeriana var. granulata]|uniref:Uncharacterized protein n=1 Tax=Oryza meyeriana var. granulata TaxID=110450 RepID=A0A6G1F7C5_9ORYZ|nr:hypothetical protein E2562_012086 [Oryza meyeriana var. granulata]
MMVSSPKLMLGAHGRASLRELPCSASQARKAPEKLVFSSGIRRAKGISLKSVSAVPDLDETQHAGARDRWAGLALDTSDDQQDIARGKGLADDLFQAPLGYGTHVPVMSSHEYVSQGMRRYAFDNTVDGYYIAPAFMDKVVVHIAKNFMDLPGIRVPVILGV